MSVTVAFPEKPTSKIHEAAKSQGYQRPEDLIVHAVEDKLSEPSVKQEIIEITDKVRTRLAEQGKQEEQLLEDLTIPGNAVS